MPKITEIIFECFCSTCFHLQKYHLFGNKVAYKWFPSWIVSVTGVTHTGSVSAAAPCLKTLRNLWVISWQWIQKHRHSSSSEPGPGCGSDSTPFWCQTTERCEKVWTGTSLPKHFKLWQPNIGYRRPCGISNKAPLFYLIFFSPC